MIIYGSVCSGIEAATVAWEPLGWKPAWFSEKDPFCKAVLKYHYGLKGDILQNIPDLGDMTEIYDKKEFKEREINLLVGGTPCQDFSLAGDRRGFDGTGGNLALEFLKVLHIKKPTWFVWENVPGLLSLNQGRNFAFIRWQLRQLGYGYATRILDAAYWGDTPRERVFVVGCLGNTIYPQRVLNETAPCYNKLTRGDNAEGRVPTLIFRNAGNQNARGVMALVGSVVSSSGQTRPYGFEQGRGLDAAWGIQRETPRTEEARMGFPKDYTVLDSGDNKKSFNRQGQALGNSMAVSVMRAIGKRIQQISKGEKNVN
ncbi:MAG: DNA (cytosine-5-)-methyltransferase [Thaumarchaeota archaeon]|nr:DNA (cytosine-5-)-methyltransferase [Nitrososphaerota archaeon]